MSSSSTPARSFTSFTAMTSSILNATFVSWESLSRSCRSGSKATTLGVVKGVQSQYRPEFEEEPETLSLQGDPLNINPQSEVRRKISNFLVTSSLPTSTSSLTAAAKFIRLSGLATNVHSNTSRVAGMSPLLLLPGARGCNRRPLN